MSAQQEEYRLHPGIIAAVVLVCLSAIVCAVFIIKKYCFPVSEVTYRYSVLRRLEDNDDQRPETVAEESDEELLE